MQRPGVILKLLSNKKPIIEKHTPSSRHQQVFLAPLPGNEEEGEEAPTSTKRQQNIKGPRSRWTGIPRYPEHQQISNNLYA
jgi:hypothetical protein